MKICASPILLFAVLTVLQAQESADVWRPAAEAKEPNITARSAILFDARSGRVLYRKNENDPMPVASTQKLLTALLVVERGNLDELVSVEQPDTLASPTKLYLKAGERYSRRKLLHALLIRSANDVALTLARDHSGSTEAFAEMMNRKVRQLGGTVSNFVNPNGLPAEGQISTAREMAAVARAAYFKPAIREIMRLQEFSFHRADGNTTHLRNTNRVLRNNPYCNGMKTGYTRLSGHCLISSAAKNGNHVIAVVLGSNKAKVWGESNSLLEYGLAILPPATPSQPSPSSASGRSDQKDYGG